MSFVGYRTVESESVTPYQYYLLSKRRLASNIFTTIFIYRRAKRLNAKHFADVGCGPANVSRLLALILKRQIVIDCYDVDLNMIKIAQKVAASQRLTNIRFHLMSDESDLPGRASFDYVFSRYVLHHVDDKLEHLMRLKEMLNPGGEIWLEDVLKGANFQRAVLALQKKIAPIRSSTYKVGLEGFLESRIQSLNKDQVISLSKGIEGGQLLSLHFGLFSWRLIFKRDL